MKNFEDNRVCVRIDTKLKEWYALQGGSKELRKALILYYEMKSNSKYEGTGK